MSDIVVQMPCPRCNRVVYLAEKGVQHDCAAQPVRRPLNVGWMPCVDCHTIPCRCPDPGEE
jgi:hypothetical protein